jgi:hypothetical protein
MALIVLASVLMGAAVAAMQAWLTLFADGSTSSVRALTIMVILVLCGLSVYVGVLRLTGVVRIDAIFGKDDRTP